MPDSNLIVVPPIPLPAEKVIDDQTELEKQKGIEKQKDYIRRSILGVSNKDPKEDEDA